MQAALTVKYFERAGEFAVGYAYIKSHTFWVNCTEQHVLLDGITVYTETAKRGKNYYFFGAAHALKEILRNLNMKVVA